jgi:hypothetical protein
MIQAFKGKLLPFLLLAGCLTMAIAWGNQEGQNSMQMSQTQGSLLVLDTAGKRGIVFFDHKSHESLINPDPDYPYKAKAGAACSGCHHTTNSLGVTQLVACRACHLEEGNPKNAKNKDNYEIFAEVAFHENCIGCHRATQKGPRLCSGCHKAVVSFP